jgi:2-oxoglutarate dehydrogenase E2 component (dihydrolipoamide succinyltransferase)
MSGEITVPELGESIVEATVGSWLKQPGDAVSMGDPVVELETEKVNMEIAAPVSGRLASILKQEGETVAIGDVLGVIGDASAATVPES